MGGTGRPIQLKTTVPMYRNPFALVRSRVQPMVGSAIKRISRFWVKKAFPWLARARWGILGSLWLLALGLGYVGFREHFRVTNEPATTWDLLYLTLQLFVMESGGERGLLSWQLQAARFLAPAVSVYTALQALALIFREHLQELMMRFVQHHVIICGLSLRGLWLAKAFRRQGHRVVVIDQSLDNENTDQFKEAGAMVVIGNPTFPDVMRTARIQRASLVIAIYEDSGINAEIAAVAEGLVSGREDDPLRCIVQIVDSHLFRLLRLRENEMWKDDSVRLEFFDMFEQGARLIVSRYPPFPNDCKGISHVLIIGAGRMGESVLVHMARKWRHQDLEPGKRMRVTIVDRSMDVRLKYLGGVYPLIEKMCDVRAITMDVTSPEFYAGGFLADDRDREDLTSIYVCLDSDSLGMDTALSLLESTRGLDVPIVVRMRHQRGLALLINGSPNTGSDFSRVKPFGLYDSIWSPELILGGVHEDLARALHQEHCRSTTPARDREEPSRLSWIDLDKETQEAFRHQSAQIINELQAIGYALEPMRNWDRDGCRFTSEQVEIMAKMRHDYLVGQYEHDRRAYFPRCELIYGDGPVTPTRWDGRQERTKELYRESVRRFPHFLDRYDLQASRLK